MKTTGKNTIFVINTNSGKVSGKKTKDCHYYKWNDDKFTRCKKADIPITEKIFN